MTIGNMAGNTNYVESVQKHTQIDGSIDSLDQTIEQAQTLLSRMRGEPIGTSDEKQEATSLSFLEVLNGSADKINDKRAQIQDILKEIENELL